LTVVAEICVEPRSSSGKAERGSCGEAIITKDMLASGWSF
jgi:hypothetical protein